MWYTLATAALVYVLHIVTHFFPLALLRRAVVYNHMGNFHMATEDLRTVLREEPQNTPATVGDGTEACSSCASLPFIH